MRPGGALCFFMRLPRPPPDPRGARGYEDPQIWPQNAPKLKTDIFYAVAFKRFCAGNESASIAHSLRFNVALSLTAHEGNRSGFLREGFLLGAQSS